MRILAIPLVAALVGCVAAADLPPPQRRGTSIPPGFYPPDPPGGGPAPMAAIPLLTPIWPLQTVELGERCPQTRPRLPAVDQPPMSPSAAREVLEDCDHEASRHLVDPVIRRQIDVERAELCQWRNQFRREGDRQICPSP